ncbi:thiamine-phosphate kinase [Allopusillimonas ginsengisoli]|uniref:thiamine-phosphate kinase n=1 Tax=Allopusillimonas ginsengisoli TaxID=453575 RepID=UPI001021872D|nr:thiamine-phosphate kinase [Allopusillimonas ginsengisoli]TEA78229.1 thiamine-phosphate kinase [Allopusillimonas ginsengisoli]
MNSEFDLIGRYFSRPAPDGMLGVGDDCALFPVAPGHQLATSIDLLIEGRHFFPDADPSGLGHKALAVNVSDLAAMGAQPLGCLLGLSLPAVDHDWLAAFAQGFHDFAAQAGCPLIGGDTTRSPSGIVISVTAFGQVRPEQALRRAAARAGDDIWITGTLGAPDIALRLLQGELPMDAGLLAATRNALERPMPPWAFAANLAGIAHAALDISDGLLQDLGHILRASGCAAELSYDSLPVDSALQGVAPDVRQSAVLAGGDVYQLCFTAPPGQRDAIGALAGKMSVRVTRVGHIKPGQGVRVVDASGAAVHLAVGGFDHFS